MVAPICTIPGYRILLQACDGLTGGGRFSAIAV